MKTRLDLVYALCKRLKIEHKVSCQLIVELAKLYPMQITTEECTSLILFTHYIAEHGSNSRPFSGVVDEVDRAKYLHKRLQDAQLENYRNKRIEGTEGGT